MRKVILAASAAPLSLILTSCGAEDDGKTHAGFLSWIPFILIVIAVTLSIFFLVIRRNDFECPKCGKTFHPKWYTVLSIHVGSSYLLRCPHCRHTGMCDLVDRKKQ